MDVPIEWRPHLAIDLREMQVQDAAQFADRVRRILAAVVALDDQLRLGPFDVRAGVGDHAVAARFQRDGGSLRPMIEWKGMPGRLGRLASVRRSGLSRFSSSMLEGRPARIAGVKKSAPFCASNAR